MAVLSITDQVDRVRVIMATYSGIGTDVSEGADIVDASKPAFEVYWRSGTRQNVQRRQSIVTRPLVVRVYAVQCDDMNDDLKSRVAIRAASAYVDPMADFLRNHPLLMLAGTDAGYVADMSAINDVGPFPLVYKSQQYAGFELEFTIVTTR